MRSQWEQCIDFLELLAEYKRKSGDKQLLKKNKLINEMARVISDLMWWLTGKFEVQDEPELQEQLTALNIYITKAKVLNVSEVDQMYCKIDEIQKIFSNSTIQGYLMMTDFFEAYNMTKFDCFEWHHSRCEKMFANIEDNKSLKQRFFVQIDHDDTGIRRYENNNLEGIGIVGEFVRLSVLSYEMLEYDSAVFDLLDEETGVFNEFIRKMYRPYFVEYYVMTDGLDEKQKNFFGNYENYQRWFPAYFVFDEKIMPDNGVLVDGVYVYSASPVIYKGRKLVIEDDSVDIDFLNKIKQTYDLPGSYCSDDKMIKRELKKKFKGVSFKKVKVYKVGNGNCTYLYGSVGKKAKRLLYDVGFDNHTAVKAHITGSGSDYSSALEDIRKMIPNCVILSHWDADHYKACAYGRKEIFECRWVAPDFKDAGVNAKRLGIYLYKTDKMMFVDRTTGRDIRVRLTSKSELTLYVGENNGELSKANCEGIAIKIENVSKKQGKIRCMMQGDVPYKSLPLQADFSADNPYDYLVVPHHGSEMDCSLLSNAGKKDGVAVICCNNNQNEKVKDRPASDHLRELKQCYISTITTEDATKYILLKLLEKNGMEVK